MMCEWNESFFFSFVQNLDGMSMLISINIKREIGKRVRTVMCFDHWNLHLRDNAKRLCLYLLLRVILKGMYENCYVHLLRLDFDNGQVGSCWAYEEARAGRFQDFLFWWTGECFIVCNFTNSCSTFFTRV